MPGCLWGVNRLIQRWYSDLVALLLGIQAKDSTQKPRGSGAERSPLLIVPGLRNSKQKQVSALEEELSR